MANKWDQRYGEPGFAYGQKPNDFLFQSLSHLPRRGRILCLAEGEGRNGVFLARQGYEVIAVDSSAVGLAKARSQAEENGVEITTIHTDLADFQLEDEHYDGVISIFCHLFPDLRKRLHRQIAATLKPGGVLILECYTPKQLELGTGGPPVRELLVGVEELRQELSELDIIHGQELEREIIEGWLHTGRGAVAQIIGIKHSSE